VFVWVHTTPLHTERGFAFDIKPEIDMNRKNKLVAGLICGNEEPRIERCVKSLQQICDEIVIIRAIGSLEPDKTLSIAKKLGCYVGEYFNSPLVAEWAHLDDFGAARNQSFSQAYELAGVDGWAMWADCDDVLMPEMAEPHLKALQDCPSDFQWILTDYVIAEQNKRAPRERFFRYKTGWWHRPIHENVQPTNDVKLYMRRDLEIVHQPPIGVRPSNERNKRILMHNDKMSSHYKFYLHYENFITGNHAESAKYGSEALAMIDLDGVHKYETLMNCSMLTTEETALRLVKQARALEPNRREAYGLEASTLLDNKKPEEALLLVEEMLKIPVPSFKQWTHREEWYSWKAQHLKAWCLRELGRGDEAKGFEMSVLNSSVLPKISLIHATRDRPLVATQAMAMWFARAKHPERIEHIFVFDEDDEKSKTLQRFRHTIQTGNGYSVGAWNLGAKECIGDIIIQLSDDWECPPNWDQSIDERLDVTKEQVLRISDGYRKDDLLCMAILTRPYFEKHGLFNPAFKNVYSDTDFTFRAAKNNAIVEAKDIAIIHHHPFWENRPLDATYERGNDVEEYNRAKKIFEGIHGNA
jgi:glycosyltransferase involved in cell wall biosynthesis